MQRDPNHPSRVIEDMEGKPHMVTVYEGFYALKQSKILYDVSWKKDDKGNTIYFASIEDYDVGFIMAKTNGARWEAHAGKNQVPAPKSQSFRLDLYDE